jgi:hypothetical protein
MVEEEIEKKSSKTEAAVKTLPFSSKNSLPPHTTPLFEEVLSEEML